MSLVRYAHYLIQVQCVTGFAVPEDYDAEDIVATVIEKNLSGSRGKNFDPSKGSFLAWLKSQIKWEIMNKIRWERSKSEVPFPVDQHGGYHEKKLEQGAKGDSTHCTESSDPEDILVSEEEAEAVWDWVYEIVNGDEELEKIVEAVENGCDFKSRNLAQALSWGIDRVNNAKKRLKRRACSSNVRRTK